MNSISNVSLQLRYWISSAGLALALGLSGCGGGESAGSDSNDRVKKAALEAATTTENDAAHVMSLTRISEKRINRTTFEYVFKPNVRAGTYSLDGVVATLVSAGQGSTIINGKVEIGEIESNSTATTNGTVTIRHDRLYPFSTNDLRWIVTGTKPVVAEVQPSGGTIEITDPKSPIKGTKITIYPATFDKSTSIEIRYSDIEKMTVSGDSTVSPNSKLIRIKRIGSDEPLKAMADLTLPYNALNKSTPIVWMREESSKPFRPLIYSKIDTDLGKITVRTAHFSEWIVTKSEKLENIKAAFDSPLPTKMDQDSGFRVNRDGFFIANQRGAGSLGTGGVCAGLAAFSSYYYSQVKPLIVENGEGLDLIDKFKQKLDQFNVTDNIEFDDVIAHELTARAWKLFGTQDLDDPRYAPRAQILIRDMIYQSIYLLSIGQPVLLGMRASSKNSDGMIENHGHEVTIYSYVGNQFSGKFLIYDNNFPASTGDKSIASINWSTASGLSDYSHKGYYGASFLGAVSYYLDSDASIVQSSHFDQLLTSANNKFKTGSYLGKISSGSDNGIFSVTPHPSVRGVDNFQPSIMVDTSRSLGNIEILDGINVDKLALEISVDGQRRQPIAGIKLKRDGARLVAVEPVELFFLPPGETTIFIKLVDNSEIGSSQILYAWGLAKINKPAASNNAIDIPATAFVRGTNVALSANGYGVDSLMNAPPYGGAVNAAEWDFNVPVAGTYELFAEFAAADSRPVVIAFNGSDRFTNALSETTGGWFPTNRQTTFQGTVTLPAGMTTMRVSRSDVFAHIRGFKLVPTQESLAPALPGPSLVIDLTPAAITALGGNGMGDFAYESAALSGRSRPAAKFSAGYLWVPHSSAMQFTDGATFDFWARIDSNSGGYMTLLAKSHDRSGVGFLMTPPNPTVGNGFGYVHTASFDPGWAFNGCQNFPAVSNVAVGSWFRMTIAISSTTGWRHYVNKQLVHTCAESRPSFALMNTQDLFIGRFSDNYWYPLNGAISDIRIYQKALTAAEVAALP